MKLTAEIYLLLAIISSAAMSIVLKLFPVKEGMNRYAIILGNYLTCVVIGFLLLPEKGLIFHPEPVTLLCGVLGGVMFFLGLFTQQKSIEVNGAILTSAFTMLGLVVPLLLSILLFGEKPTAMQAAGIVLVIIAVLVINGAKKEEGLNLQIRPILLVFVLLSYGGAGSMSKIFESVGSRAQDELYIFYVFVFASVLTAFLMWSETKIHGKKISGKDFLAGVLVGIPNYFSSALQLAALVGLPAIIVYPTFSTGVIVLVTLVGAIAFKEKPGKRGWIGVGIILAAVLLLNLGG